MRRLYSLSLITLFSLTMLLTLSAQEPAKKEAEPKAPAESNNQEKPKESPKQEEAPKSETPSAEPAPKAEEAPLKPITPDVEAKLEAARKAVAELIVAAEDAGLVETTIDQPPILDLLITGRATDLRELKKPAAERSGVSPEVFGAWFTGHGKKAEELSGLAINPQADVRIIQPAKGLSEWYEKRTNMLNTYVAQARSAKAAELAKQAEEAKAAEAAKPKAEQPKAETPKAEQPKAEQPKAESPNAEQPKAEQPKAETPKVEQPKA